jgi:hypothetical protein
MMGACALSAYLGFVLCACFVLGWWHIRQLQREAAAPVAPEEPDELRPMERVERPASMREVVLRGPGQGELWRLDNKRHPHVAARLRLIASGRWQDEGLGWADETREQK